FSNSEVALKNEDILENKIRAYIIGCNPIQTLILGFPNKSSNTESKVIRAQFDMADLIGLLTLYHITQEVKKIYEPGIVITLYTREPFIYQMNKVVKDRLRLDLFNEADVERYQSDLKYAVSIFQPALQLGDIPDIRKIYLDKYGELDVE